LTQNWEILHNKNQHSVKTDLVSTVNVKLYTAITKNVDIRIHVIHLRAQPTCSPNNQCINIQL